MKQQLRVIFPLTINLPIMRKSLFLFSLLILLLFQQAAIAQSTVTGTVSGTDNAALAGVTVTVSGSKTATVTDAQGRYSIAVPANASLIFNYVGFAKQTIAVGGRGVIDIAMEVQNRPMDEVVVTGYSSQRRRDITGSVAVVDVKAMKSLPAGSAMQAIQGMAAGVDVINNGAPGEASKINIRGLTGFTNAPLVLIDGMQGQINDVPSNDVESIQILKDAGAAAIYGVRGSNGVVIITTKKGRSSVPQISYDAYAGIQIPKTDNPLNLLNAQEYANIYSALVPSTTIFPGGQIPDFYYKTPAGIRGAGNAGDPAVDPSNYAFDPNNEFNNYQIMALNKGQTNMYDLIFRNALQMNHSISVSGGSDKGNYMLSLGYLDQQGPLIETALKRYSLRMNSMYKIRNHIRIGENLYLHYKDNPTTNPNASFGPVAGAIAWMPFLSPYDIRGNYAGPGVGPLNELGDGGNPIAELKGTSNTRNREWLMQGNVFAEVDFLKHFTIATKFGGNINNYYVNTFEFNPYWRQNGGNNTNRLTENSGYYTTMQWTNTLSYKQTFGKHNVNALVGTESINNWARSQTGAGTKFFSTDYNYLVLTQAQERLVPPTSGATEDALFSLFGQLNYDYDDKYLVGITGRRDGFSHFGRDVRYGNFGAVSVGWRISNERFMQGISWLNNLMIKGSYGVLGSKEGIPLVNSFTTYAQYNGSSYYDINGIGNALVSGFYPARNGNSKTSWERNKTLNIGFDATLFNKLDLTVEYYEKKIDGLLRVRQTPATAGEAAAPFVNDGDIQNKGWDISATYREQIGKDFRFSVGVNFTTYKNKIVSLPDPSGFSDEGQIRYAEGMPMSSFFGYEVEKVFSDQREVDEAPVQQDKEPGRFKFRDIDGNDTINEKDRTFYGNANPKFTIGLNLAAQYKSFDFSAIFYSSQGNDIYNSTLAGLDDWSRKTNKTRRVLDAWTPTNTETSVQKNELARNFSTTANNVSTFVEDGSYIRLRSLVLGYNLSPALVSKLKINRLRLYLQGTNLFTSTNYSGLDPEIPAISTGFRGVDVGVYPQVKSFIFGLNIGF